MLKVQSCFRWPLISLLHCCTEVVGRQSGLMVSVQKTNEIYYKTEHLADSFRGKILPNSVYENKSSTKTYFLIMWVKKNIIQVGVILLCFCINSISV